LNDSTEPSKTDYKTDPSIFSAIFRIYVCYADVSPLAKQIKNLPPCNICYFWMYVFHADVSNALNQANVMDGPVNPFFSLSLSLFFFNHDQTQ
jgi:hypothetical protein